MANLDLIERFNNKYGKTSPIINNANMDSLDEAINPDIIQKAINNSISDLGFEYTMYFEFGMSVEVVLIYIDVCGFSTRFSHLEGEQIGEYFDEYYDIVIPIIYEYGGEIDKIMGDGIICIFGPPFQDLKLIENINKADICSKEIIKATINTKFESKIAIHCGSVNYFKNKTTLYNEFTIIGKPLTELFRLESISIDQRINYYKNTDISKYYIEFNKLLGYSPGKPKMWSHYTTKINNLKGVDFDKFISIKYNNK